MTRGFRLSNKGKRTGDYTSGYNVEHRKQGVQMRTRANTFIKDCHGILK